MNIEQLKQYEPLFGSWVIDSKVADGKNSVLYRVVRNQNGSEYAAVKVITCPLDGIPAAPKKGRAKGRDGVSLFEENVKSNMNKMLSLRVNKNIVRVDNYMTVNDGGALYVIILTELLTPLNNFLTQEKFNCRQIAKIAADLCCAIDGFRKIGVIHREIRPENIFVDDEGNFKLGDFGIVDNGVLGGESETSSAYLAPEVLNASGADNCSDIYSLGLLMYKFLNNNRMPFMPEFPNAINDTDKRTAFERRMAGEQLVKPANADIPLTRIILRACAFKAEERYASASQMRNDLVKYIEYAPEDDSSDKPKKKTNAYLSYKPAASPIVSAESSKPRTSYVDNSVRAATEHAEAFSDRADDPQRAKLKKKKTTLAAVCVILAAVVVGGVCIVMFGGDDVKNTTANTTLPVAPTFNEYQASDFTNNTTLPTLPTTQPTTEGTTERTTEATTERTTERTTESTTERTTERTTENPTVSTTRREYTTRPTTAASATQSPAETTTRRSVLGSLFGGNNKYSVTLYKRSSHSDGDKAGSGRTYREANSVSGHMNVIGSTVTSVVVNIDDLGRNPKKSGEAYVCRVKDGEVVSKQPINFSCARIDNEYNAYYTITANVNVEYSESEQIYVVFEEGAIRTDTAVNLPFQIEAKAE